MYEKERRGLLTTPHNRDRKKIPFPRGNREAPTPRPHPPSSRFLLGGLTPLFLCRRFERPLDNGNDRHETLPTFRYGRRGETRGAL